MGWGWGVLDGFSVYMEGLVQFNDYVFSLSLFIFWFVVMLVVYEVVGGSGDRDLSGVFVLEMVWTMLPLILLVFMAYPSMVLLYLGDVVSELGGEVIVVAHQWYWGYVAGGGSVDSYMVSDGGYRVLDVDNRLVVASFVPVGVSFTSSDVIHSWAVPSLGVKVDCVPGRLNYVELEVLGPGVFYGQCSELCGVLHSFMPVVVESVCLF